MGGECQSGDWLDRVEWPNIRGTRSLKARGGRDVILDISLEYILEEYWILEDWSS